MPVPRIAPAENETVPGTLGYSRLEMRRAERGFEWELGGGLEPIRSS
jgi:hypothetical protein